MTFCKKKEIVLAVVVALVIVMAVFALTIAMLPHKDSDPGGIDAVWYYTAEPTYSSDKTIEYGGTLRVEVVNGEIVSMTHKITSKSVDPSTVPYKPGTIIIPRDPPVPYTDEWKRMKEIEKLPIVQGYTSTGLPSYIDDEHTMMTLSFYNEQYQRLLVREDGTIIEVTLPYSVTGFGEMKFIKDY